MTQSILLVTPNFNNNSLGRTYCLWMLARYCGYDCQVVGIRGNSIWEPLAGTDFASACLLPKAEPGLTWDGILAAAGGVNLVIAVKAMSTSYGVAQRIRIESSVPLLLDVDDPDVEVRSSWLPRHERLARWLLTRRYRDLVELGRQARREVLMVSNPVLAQLYGGVVIPHIRVPSSRPHYSTSHHPVIRFVGTVREHKGVAVLRRAVAELEGQGFTLEVTAPAPPDALPWETWIGRTTLDQGRQLVERADIVVVPSVPVGYARAQLPVKLVDAMSAGRAIVASDLAPIRWALGPSGRLVPSGDVARLAAALVEMADPATRARIGESAWVRAKRMFTVERVAPAFDGQVRLALTSRGKGH